MKCTVLLVTCNRTAARGRVFLTARNVDGHLHRRVRLILPHLHQTPTVQQRLPVSKQYVAAEKPYHSLPLRRSSHRRPCDVTRCASSSVRPSFCLSIFQFSRMIATDTSNIWRIGENLCLRMPLVAFVASVNPVNLATLVLNGTTIVFKRAAVSRATGDLRFSRSKVKVIRHYKDDTQSPSNRD